MADLIPMADRAELRYLLRRASRTAPAAGQRIALRSLMVEHELELVALALAALRHKGVVGEARELLNDRVFT